jgi:type I restriction enzyme, R subunit
MIKFTEEKLELAILELLGKEGFPHVHGGTLERATGDVLLRDNLREYLSRRYAADGITEGEIEHIIRRLDAFSSTDLYESNKAIMKMVLDGFLLKREDRSQKDLYVELIDYRGIAEQRHPKPGEVPTVVAEEFAKYNASYNIFKAVNQLKIVGTEKL